MKIEIINAQLDRLTPKLYVTINDGTKKKKKKTQGTKSLQLYPIRQNQIKTFKIPTASEWLVNLT